jgi:hypothetical protein
MSRTLKVMCKIQKDIGLGKTGNCFPGCISTTLTMK